MDHLVPANRECEGDGPSHITAAGRHVVIIGGGDTGADCLGTAHRQGAASVTQLDYNPQPPELRDDVTSPWPTWPLVLRTSPAHAEGGARHYEVAVQRFLGDAEGRLRALEIAEVRWSAIPTAAASSHRWAPPWRSHATWRCSPSVSRG